jgi:hypothetical protein
MSSSELQMNIRILMYALFSGLASYGITTPDSTQNIIIGAVGFAATYAWTRWGMRLNGLLEYAKSKAGVEQIEAKVDPEIIKPSAINDNTSSGITAKAA